MTPKTTIIPAVMAVALTSSMALASAMALASSMASAAPVAPLVGVDMATPPLAIQYRGGNWRDHPLMYSGNWWAHQRQWDASEGRGPYARSTSCARLRAYDPASHTYVNRSGRRVRCP